LTDAAITEAARPIREGARLDWGEGAAHIAACGRTLGRCPAGGARILPTGALEHVDAAIGSGKAGEASSGNRRSSVSAGGDRTGHSDERSSPFHERHAVDHRLSNCERYSLDRVEQRRRVQREL